MKLYDLGKNHCDYFNQFIPNPAQPEPKPDEESRMKELAAKSRTTKFKIPALLLPAPGNIPSTA